jgi:ribulose 1,5-bisphosphate carboxylase large subunit-like protein
MDERREPVTPVMVTKLCQTCGADMKSLGEGIGTWHGTKWSHVCSADPTHLRADFAKNYPCVEFEVMK